LLTSDRLRAHDRSLNIHIDLLGRVERRALGL
jgi:hypothetical protein